jgi:hypothetical protein
MNILSKKIRKISKGVSNLLGWHTKHHIVVIESDDWGSIRMSSKNAFRRLEAEGLNLRAADAERYNLNDCLECTKDLEYLFEVLSGVKDSNGNHPVFTPVTIVANPDFGKIEDSGFSGYFYEPFTTTLQRYYGSDMTMKLWKEGIERRLFAPQLHGREHLNIAAWMRDLQNGNRQTRTAFSENVWGFIPDGYPATDYQAAFLLEDPSEVEYQKTILQEAMILFKEIFGFSATYFVPPNGPFNNQLNEVLARSGIKYRYASRIQHESIGKGKNRRVIHWHGQKDRYGLTYILRNCIFEPSQDGRDWIDNCLNDIKTAFYWNKPAIISSHRVNYIGSLNPANRDKGLKQLDKLIKSIIKIWPDVIFMPTSELGELINTN